MIVVNQKQLAVNFLRRDALKIIESAYEAIDIEKLTKKRFKLSGNKLLVSDAAQTHRFDLKKVKRIYLIGFGKGSALAIATMAKILLPLGKKFSGAIALDIHHSKFSKGKLGRVKFFTGTHPKPSLKNVRATQYIVRTLETLGEDDLVIYFIGGGGSSLLSGSHEEYRRCTTIFDVLTRKGASIQELNTVRKHLSLVKGGWLAYHTYPAQSVSLIVSDVCGNDFSVIASGPTVFDRTIKKDAQKIIEKYLRTSAQKSAIIGSLIETPKNKKYFKKTKYLLFACNEDAVLAMKKRARSLGYGAKIISLAYQGEAQKLFAPLIRKISKKEIFLLAGETTVKIRGKGKGGRNQEAVLGALAQVYRKKIGLKNILVTSFSSDGYDNTPVAGALADKKTLEIVKKRKIDPAEFLKNNDSYNFFKKAGGQIVVERRAFNVSDLMMVMKD